MATIELVRKREDKPTINASLVEMLRQVLALAESGDIQAAAVAYVQEGIALICYEAEGYEAEMACAGRQIDDELRRSMFPEDE